MGGKQDEDQVRFVCGRGDVVVGRSGLRLVTQSKVISKVVERPARAFLSPIVAARLLAADPTFISLTFSLYLMRFLEFL